MDTHIDHLVIGAETLQLGVEYVQAQLGVDIPFGGVHPKMGTHNHLMQLGKALFLEVIAINPDMPQPATPRWFGLDDPHVRRSLSGKPRLLAWVVNTSDIQSLSNQTGFCFGQAELISRGELSWLFGLPDDGRLLAGGMLPYLMQWHTTHHPASGMPDKACRFESLCLYHPRPEWLAMILKSIGIDAQIHIRPLPENTTPYMIACIKTPLGIRQLSSKDLIS